MDAASHLERLARKAAAEGRIRNSLVSKIAAYHALFSDKCKEDILEDFRKGNILLLLATEAAGMGCDIDDVTRVIQFKCPKNISCLVQRLGRAARSPQLQGVGILFAEKRSPGSTYPDEYLDQYINTRECRRKVLNGLYRNEYQPNGNCCDLCHPEMKPLQPQQTVAFKEVQAGHIAKPRPRLRTVAQKELVKAALLEWRAAAHLRDMTPHCDY
ncbi:ATP-dependent DNA helicase sgs1, partial [Podila clonocystis]